MSNIIGINQQKPKKVGWAEKKEDTINLQNFETDLDISIKPKILAGKKSEVEVFTPTLYPRRRVHIY